VTFWRQRHFHEFTDSDMHASFLPISCQTDIRVGLLLCSVAPWTHQNTGWTAWGRTKARNTNHFWGHF